MMSRITITSSWKQLWDDRPRSPVKNGTRKCKICAERKLQPSWSLCILAASQEVITRSTNARRCTPLCCYVAARHRCQTACCRKSCLNLLRTCPKVRMSHAWRSAAHAVLPLTLQGPCRAPHPVPSLAWSPPRNHSSGC